MAYTVLLVKHTCSVCGNIASLEVRNRYNAHVGFYCRLHGVKAADAMTKAEQPIKKEEPK